MHWTTGVMVAHQKCFCLVLKCALYRSFNKGKPIFRCSSDLYNFCYCSSCKLHRSQPQKHTDRRIFVSHASRLFTSTVRKCGARLRRLALHCAHVLITSLRYPQNALLCVRREDPRKTKSAGFVMSFSKHVSQVIIPGFFCWLLTADCLFRGVLQARHGQQPWSTTSCLHLPT